MLAEPLDEKGIVERIEKLERLVQGLGEIVGGLVDQAGNELARKIDKVPTKLGMVVAEEFVLKNHEGRLGATLGFLESGPALVLYDADREGRTVLGIQKDKAILSLEGPAQAEKAGLMVGLQGPQLMLSDKEGLAVLMGSINRLAREHPLLRGIPESQQPLQAIMVMQGSNALWGAPPSGKRFPRLVRLFKWLME